MELLHSHITESLGLPPRQPTPILPIQLGDEAAVQEAGAFLLSRGIHVGVIRPPTVPANTCRYVGMAGTVWGGSRLLLGGTTTCLLNCGVLVDRLSL